MDIVAIVPADPPILDWLGDSSSLELAVRKLEDFREIDRIAVLVDKEVSHPDETPALRDAVAMDDRVRVYFPIARDEHAPLADEIAAYLRASDDGHASHYLLVNPAFPFLDRDTIAKVLYAVHPEGHPAAVTVSGKYIVQAQADGARLIRGCSVYDACLAVTHGLWESQAGGLADGKDLRLGHTVGLVSINQLEAINLRDARGWEMAFTLAAFGS